MNPPNDSCIINSHSYSQFTGENLFEFIKSQHSNFNQSDLSNFTGFYPQEGALFSSFPFNQSYSSVHLSKYQQEGVGISASSFRENYTKEGDRISTKILNQLNCGIHLASILKRALKSQFSVLTNQILVIFGQHLH